MGHKHVLIVRRLTGNSSVSAVPMCPDDSVVIRAPGVFQVRHAEGTP